MTLNEQIAEIRKTLADAKEYASDAASSASDAAERAERLEGIDVGRLASSVMDSLNLESEIESAVETALEDLNTRDAAEANESAESARLRAEEAEAAVETAMEKLEKLAESVTPEAIAAKVIMLLSRQILPVVMEAMGLAEPEPPKQVVCPICNPQTVEPNICTGHAAVEEVPGPTPDFAEPIVPDPAPVTGVNAHLSGVTGL